MGVAVLHACHVIWLDDPQLVLHTTPPFHLSLQFTDAMGHTDRTADFWQVIKSKQGLTPPAKRRKVATEIEPRDTFGKRYMEEAYIIVRPLFQVPLPIFDMTSPAEPHKCSNAGVEQHSAALPQRRF